MSRYLPNVNSNKTVVKLLTSQNMQTAKVQIEIKIVQNN